MSKAAFDIEEAYERITDAAGRELAPTMQSGRKSEKYLHTVKAAAVLIRAMKTELLGLGFGEDEIQHLVDEAYEKVKA